MTIYKSGRYFDYGDYGDQSLESLQYSAATKITGAIRETSSEKLFQKLGLETLKSRLWLRKLFLFYKLVKKKSTAYLFQLIPENKISCTTRNVQKKSNPLSQDKKKHFFSKILSFLEL